MKRPWKWGLILILLVMLTVQVQARSGLELWSFDFEEQSEWPCSRDKSVDCEECPADITDVATYLSYNWPGKGTVMVVHGNVKGEECINTNAIGHYPVEWQGGGNYQTRVHMRTWQYTGEYKSHHTDINFGRTTYDGYDEEREKHAFKVRLTEVGVMYNQWHELEGWLYYRDENLDLVGVVDLSDGHPNWRTAWHFVIVNNVMHPDSDYFKLTSIYCDGSWYIIQSEMSTFYHYVDYEWQWSENVTVMVESPNVWTQCSEEYTFQSINLYDNISCTYYE